MPPNRSRRLFGTMLGTSGKFRGARAASESEDPTQLGSLATSETLLEQLTSHLRLGTSLQHAVPRVA